MSNQEAIEMAIRCCKNIREQSVTNHITASMDIAIGALEKQIFYKGEDIQTTDDEWMGVRCKCGNGVPYLMRFCGKCGQAIDWSEVE